MNITKVINSDNPPWHLNCAFTWFIVVQLKRRYGPPIVTGIMQ